MLQPMIHITQPNSALQRALPWQEIVSPKEQSPASTHRAGASTTRLWHLWDEQQSYFQRLARRWMNGNYDDAAEALNQAAFAVWQHAPAAEHTVTNPVGWLTGLLRHTCLDLHRTQQRYSRQLERLDTDAAEGMTVEMTDECLAARPAQSPEVTLLLREKCAYVHAAIEALPERLRTPLILHCCHELSCAEIGMKLNLAPDNVRKRIQLARITLRGKVRAYQAGLAGPETQADWPEAEQLFAYPVSSPPAGIVAGVDAEIQPRVRVLDQPSKREEQKLCTLRAYVQRYPTGWKKQLELADQLCKMGHSAEALTTYQQVLQKQPHLLSVWVQVGRVYQGLGQSENAVAAYEQALPLATSEEGCSYVSGLIESA